jgi:hypothetical protein
VKQIGDHGTDREEQAQYINPKGSVNAGIGVITEPELKEQGSKADCGDHHQSQRTQKGASAGVENHETQGEQKKTGGH